MCVEILFGRYEVGEFFTIGSCGIREVLDYNLQVLWVVFGSLIGLVVTSLAYSCIQRVLELEFYIEMVFSVDIGMLCHQLLEPCVICLLIFDHNETYPVGVRGSSTG